MRRTYMKRHGLSALSTTTALPVCLLVATLTACVSSQPPQPGGGARTPGSHPAAGTASSARPAEPADDGVVRGRLVFVGGPAPGSPRPLRTGTVSLTGDTQVKVSVSRTGRYSVALPAGTYDVTGRSQQYGSGSYECRAVRPVRVRPHTTSWVDVLCQLG